MEEIMKQSLVFACLTLMLMISLVSGNGLQAQESKLASSVGPQQNADHKTVGFRVTRWQVKHMHDAKKAKELVASLKKVGCEVTQAAHNGHTDVRYRCQYWKLITVENKEFAAQWSKWLHSVGMDTVVVDPDESIAKDTVDLRLANWRTMHLHDKTQADEITNMLKAVGCEVERSAHDGHIDLRFRCPEWKTIALGDHPSSHVWQNWLNENGFETKHKH